MLRLGEAMSIFARRVRAPSGNSPAFMRCEQIEVFLDRAVAVGAVLARLGQRAALLANLIGGQIADVGLAGLDQLHGPFVELVEIIGRVEQPVFPIAAQPADIFDDRIDVLRFFLRRIGVVEPQVALAAELLGEAEIQVDRLGVADVQIAVRLRRKARVHAAAVFVGLQIVEDDLADEVGRRRLGWMQRPRYRPHSLTDS